MGDLALTVADQIVRRDRLPGLGTTQAATTSPYFASGRPTTATSATAG